jgi:hypothetical protein
MQREINQKLKNETKRLIDKLTPLLSPIELGRISKDLNLNKRDHREVYIDRLKDVWKRRKPAKTDSPLMRNKKAKTALKNFQKAFNERAQEVGVDISDVAFKDQEGQALLKEINYFKNQIKGLIAIKERKDRRERERRKKYKERNQDNTKRIQREKQRQSNTDENRGERDKDQISINLSVCLLIYRSIDLFIFPETKKAETKLERRKIK